MVVTSAFHQLRSFLTFRCAVRQSLPPEQRMKVQDEPHLPIHILWAAHKSCLQAAILILALAATPTAIYNFLVFIEQVWVAHVPVEGLQLDGLSLQRVYSAWDFWRELAAIGYYFLRGWLC